MNIFSETDATSESVSRSVHFTARIVERITSVARTYGVIAWTRCRDRVQFLKALKAGSRTHEDIMDDAQERVYPYQKFFCLIEPFCARESALQADCSSY